MQDDGPRLTFLGKAFLVGFMLICAAGAWWLFNRGDSEVANQPSAPAGGESNSTTSSRSEAKTVVRIAYGTEKRRWLTYAVDKFAETRDGKSIGIDLIPLGSLEGARETVKGDKKIHVWSPASSAFKNVFLNEWELSHGGNPIAREERLALTPMVFVMWKDRFDEFEKKQGALNFETIRQAVNEPGGWDTIAGKPEWGFFKFGHTNPNQSNSGMLALTLMAHHYHDKTTPLELQDIVNAEFQTWLKGIEGNVTGLINSTGNMMRDMVLKGPASYDCIFVYENVAIDYLKNAEGRWGKLHVVYPDINMWNDNPYYVIDAPWTSSAEKKAAEKFLDFLMSEVIQKQSLTHGFRPGNPAIPVIGPDSPFTRFEEYGMTVQINSVAEPPKAEAITNLLTGWQRLRN